MTGVIVFATTLLLAVPVSGLARRSILSTAVLFLVVGALFGTLGLGVLDIGASDRSVTVFTEVALFAVLFTDGMRLGSEEPRWAWRLPARLLLIGMPLTFAATAVAGRLLVGLSWVEAMLVAAALAPTDPVLASAIVGRREVPRRIRRLLNIESGLNDGLALPVVIVLLDVVSKDTIDGFALAASIVGGVLIGIAIPAATGYALRRLPGRVTARYQALAPVAIGMLVFAISERAGANIFLAAFAAGSTVGVVSPTLCRAFERFGELVTELLKLGALLLFGALLTGAVFTDAGLAGFAFAVFTLTIARAGPVAVALKGTSVRGKELLTVAWFGPKGFASVIYSLLILAAGVPDGQQMTELIALTVVLSIVVHSSTDVAVARAFETTEVTGGRS